MYATVRVRVRVSSPLPSPPRSTRVTKPPLTHRDVHEQVDVGWLEAATSPFAVVIVLWMCSVDRGYSVVYCGDYVVDVHVQTDGGYSVSQYSTSRMIRQA